MFDDDITLRSTQMKTSTGSVMIDSSESVSDCDLTADIISHVT